MEGGQGEGIEKDRGEDGGGGIEPGAEAGVGKAGGVRDVQALKDEDVNAEAEDSGEEGSEDEFGIADALRQWEPLLDG